MMVDSRATTGVPAFSDSATSSLNRIGRLDSEYSPIADSLARSRPSQALWDARKRAGVSPVRRPNCLVRVAWS